MQDDDVIIEADGSEELNGEGPQADTKLAKLKRELEAAKKEKQEYLDGWQRAKADYVNALKRFDEDKKNVYENGKIFATAKFLPVLDSLERAEAAGEVPDSFQGIAKQLHDAAKSLGLEKFGAVGETFDPMHHEALGQDPVDSRDKDDTIMMVLETGWKSGDEVIRPAKVRVGHFGG